MKRILTIIIGFILVIPVYASHIVGGEMFYDCLGNNRYRVTVKVYRDCNSTGAQFDQNLPLTIFDGKGNRLNNENISFPGSHQLIVNFNNNPCVTFPTNICIEVAVYQKTITLLNSTSGYVLSYQRCCRGPNVTNLKIPENQGLTLMCEVPPNIVASCNSSPRFTNFPPLVLCTQETLEFDHSATDPNGDNLVYSLCPPFQGGTSANPAPNPSTAPPYNLVNWGTGFSNSNPFGTGTISIEPTTGKLTAKPQLPGIYAVGVCVEEYRNGSLIGTTRRDFLFRVVDCTVELESKLTPQVDLPTFISFCDGLKVEFKNESFGATTYHWDFGVKNLISDVSSLFEPTYTYPGPGIYEVSLIASKQLGCSDTTKQTFIIGGGIDIDFAIPESQCIVGNSFNFDGRGRWPQGSTFLWDFGPHSTPNTSTDISPRDIVFSESGPHEVSFTATLKDCIDNFKGEIFVHDLPVIDFKAVETYGCAPYRVEFVNLSSSHSSTRYNWTFGDSISADAFEPYYVYLDSGVYSIGLTLFSTIGCLDTLELKRDNYISVYPTPKASFEVSPLIQEEFTSNFTFVNLADESADHTFNFGNGEFSNLNQIDYAYPKAGIYYPNQVVKNEFGCEDKMKVKIIVKPATPVIVPNAFTPNGSGPNNTFKPILYYPQNYKMWIYNRWGELLFKSEHPEAEWDGIYDGIPVPTGVYVWKIEYEDFLSEFPIIISGHVTLLR